MADGRRAFLASRTNTFIVMALVVLFGLLAVTALAGGVESAAARDYLSSPVAELTVSELVVILVIIGLIVR